jgi:hypothetical protein
MNDRVMTSSSSFVAGRFSNLRGNQQASFCSRSCWIGRIATKVQTSRAATNSAIGVNS